MTEDEWKSLQVGSIISFKNGRCTRAVLIVHQYGGITVPSKITKRGWTTYVKGDRYLFKLIGKIKTKCQISK